MMEKEKKEKGDKNKFYFLIQFQNMIKFKCFKINLNLVTVILLY